MTESHTRKKTFFSAGRSAGCRFFFSTLTIFSFRSSRALKKFDELRSRKGNFYDFCGILNQCIEVFWTRSRPPSPTKKKKMKFFYIKNKHHLPISLKKNETYFWRCSISGNARFFWRSDLVTGTSGPALTESIGELPE